LEGLKEKGSYAPENEEENLIKKPSEKIQRMKEK
jgi:hypothetical protein